MKHLEQYYPCLYIYVIRKRGMDNELDRYMQECKKYENSNYNYSMYVHGYFIPWLQQQRETGNIVKGKSYFL